MDDIPLISVIIAAGRQDLRGTLLSLEQQDYPTDKFEVIVVTELTDVSLHPSLEIKLISARDKNPAYKRNLGGAASRGGILAFIDDDATAPPNWLTVAQSLMGSRPEIAGCGGPNLLPEKVSLGQHLSDALLTLPVLGSGNPSYGGQTVTRIARPGDIHLVNMFVRREIFERVGGFNESVGYGGEDTEFIHHVKQQTGLDFIFAAQLVVDHFRRSFGFSYLRQRFMLRRNNGRLFLAFPAIYRRSRAFWAMALGPLAFLVILALAPHLALLMVFIYLLGIAFLGLLHHPRLTPMLMLAAPLHHAAYALGFYAGLLSALMKRQDIQRLRQRTPLFDR